MGLLTSESLMKKDHFPITCSEFDYYTKQWVEFTIRRKAHDAMPG